MQIFSIYTYTIYLVAANFLIMTRSFEEIASELQNDRVLLVGGAGLLAIT